MRALVVNPVDHPLPDGSDDLLQGIGWDVVAVGDYTSAVDAVRDGSVSAVLLPEATEDSGLLNHDNAFVDLLRIIDAQRIAAVMVTENGTATKPGGKSLVDMVSRDISLAELRGRFAMIERYHGHLRLVEQELRNMERQGKRLDQHFRELDQEMRLAGRLQRDFLPKVAKPIGNIQFATVFRPASWVSGDTFDIFRIDERFTGVYVADAVGHGMAASLLTMFIRRAIISKHVQGDHYTVLSPSETVAGLNDALADQSLPNCQFVTACYALIDHQTLTLRYARGGHPYPLLITPDGVANELKASGGLLGIFKGQEFPTFETKLKPGDKLLFYTDGVELAFQGPESDGLDTSAYHRTFAALSSLSITDMLKHIESELDDESGSLNPQDDVTIVGLEVLAD
ncbi:MAG: serine/threonine-protein phosphatase [Phycisphaerales bacterium]|nr:MAG: serine/threonine-protein phosphatase [Phycisphaerales bacterium]